MTISLAVIAGTKLNKSIKQNKKINYYSNLNRRLYSRLLEKSPEFKDFEFPKWEDDESWGRIFENESGTILGNKFPSYKEMRDFCYTQAADEINPLNCDTSMGWCMPCMKIKKR